MNRAPDLVRFVERVERARDAVLRAAKRLYRARRRAQLAVTEHVCSGYSADAGRKLGDANEAEANAAEALDVVTGDLYRAESAARKAGRARLLGEVTRGQ